MSRDGLPGMGEVEELGRCVTTQKGITGLLEGLCIREGKVGYGFVLVISIAGCNQIAHWECTL